MFWRLAIFVLSSSMRIRPKQLDGCACQWLRQIQPSAHSTTLCGLLFPGVGNPSVAGLGLLVAQSVDLYPLRFRKFRASVLNSWLSSWSSRLFIVAMIVILNPR